MEQNLTLTLSLLERTPRAFDALLRGLPDAWTRQNEGGSTWTAIDIVGHLVHCERADWMPRIQRILQQGEAAPFEPLDREAQKSESAGKPLEQLLEEFSELRSGNLAAIRELNLRPGDLTRRGVHPSLGSVTLSQLFATWAGHDMTHLHQLSRLLAFQYADAVGPWKRFLGVLACTGHSTPA